MRAVGGLVILLVLAGCGGWRMQAQAPAPKPLPSKYRFDYTVTNAAPISLLRVFDDGGSTYFQFRSNPPEALVISAETATGEAIIPHESMGNYAVLRGVYRQSSIASANQPVVARKLGKIAPMANVGPVVLPKPLVQASASTEAEAKPVPAVTRLPVKRALGTHMIRFARNSAKLGPKGRTDLESVIAAARQASEIEIRVRPFYATRQTSIRLAQARAETIRMAMTAEGVPSDNIRIEGQGAANALIAEVALRVTDYEAVSQAEAPSSARASEDHAGPQRFGLVKTAAAAAESLYGE
jgi:outer membrane protein OmpA-like peptidoglycan-associated protein